MIDDTARSPHEGPIGGALPDAAAPVMPAGPTASAQPQDRPALSRRALVRGGLSATPMLLSLASRPVMAAPCEPASSFTSASLSRPKTGLPPCLGAGPDYWKAESSFPDWPAPMAVPVTPMTASGTPTTDATLSATLFNNVFGSSGGYPRSTLLDVLRLNATSGRDGLARYCAAGYLNALKNRIPAAVLDVSVVKNVWASFVARGYYEPTAGVKWYPDYSIPASDNGGIVAWLKTTMPR